MKRITVMALFALSYATAAHAGVMEVVSGLPGIGTLAVGAGALVIAYILKQIPNDVLSGAVKKFFRGIGVTITLGATKWKVTKNFWNSLIEPWVIDLIDNTVGAAVAGLIEGLRTDNTNA